MENENFGKERAEWDIFRFSIVLALTMVLATSIITFIAFQKIIFGEKIRFTVQLLQPRPLEQNNSLQIDHWHFRSFEIVTNQNDHKSVAFAMYSFMTSIICWKLLSTFTIFIC